MIDNLRKWDIVNTDLISSVRNDVGSKKPTYKDVHKKFDRFLQRYFSQDVKERSVL